jgi:hypothetical protein
MFRVPPSEAAAAECSVRAILQGFHGGSLFPNRQANTYDII